MTEEEIKAIREFFDESPICTMRDGSGEIVHHGEECHCKCGENGRALFAEVERLRGIVNAYAIRLAEIRLAEINAALRHEQEAERLA